MTGGAPGERGDAPLQEQESRQPPRTIVFLTSLPLRLEPLLSAVRGPSFGAIVTFTGTTRASPAAARLSRPLESDEEDEGAPGLAQPAQLNARLSPSSPCRVNDSAEQTQVLLTRERRDFPLAVARLDYEAYLPMARKELSAVCERARATTSEELGHILVAHKVGACPVEEAGVIICVSSAHRAAAFQACQFIIDDLKKKVPIWKQEILHGRRAAHHS